MTQNPDELLDEERDVVKAKFKEPDNKQAQVSAEYVFDKVLDKHFLRMKFKTFRLGNALPVISSIDIPADQTKDKLIAAAGISAGALCETHHEKYGETCDPSDAAKAGVESFRKLREMVRGERDKIIVN